MIFYCFLLLMSNEFYNFAHNNCNKMVYEIR